MEISGQLPRQRTFPYTAPTSTSLYSLSSISRPGCNPKFTLAGGSDGSVGPKTIAIVIKFIVTNAELGLVLTFCIYVSV